MCASITPNSNEPPKCKSLNLPEFFSDRRSVRVTMSTKDSTCDWPQEVGIHLRQAVESQQPVALLLDIRQLRVAEALDRPGREQRFDEGPVSLEQLRRAR